MTEFAVRWSRDSSELCRRCRVLVRAGGPRWCRRRVAARLAPPPTAKAIAPIDLTGYWTAVITEDWHVRMLDAVERRLRQRRRRHDRESGRRLHRRRSESVRAGQHPVQRRRPLRMAMKWDPAKDEAEGNACKAYGAAGHHAAADAPAHHVAGREHAEDRSGLRDSRRACFISVRRHDRGTTGLQQRDVLSPRRRSSNRRRESNRAGRAIRSPRGRSWVEAADFERGGSLKVVTHAA